MVALFKKIENYFLFSFPEKKRSLLAFLLFIYLKAKKCPYSNKYSKEEMRDIMPNRHKKNYFFVEKNGHVFLTNIPLK